VHQNLAALDRADIEKIRRMFSGERRVVLKRDAGLKEDPAENAAASPGQEEPAGNPYAAPRAELQPAAACGSEDFIDPQRRPASRGASWFFQAVSLFLKSPFVWMLTMICFFSAGTGSIYSHPGRHCHEPAGTGSFCGANSGGKGS